MRKGAAFWNEQDTKVFCEICREEVDAGNRVDGYLSAEGYRNLQLKFNARTQKGYVKEHFKYRWNSLKYEYTRFRNGLPDNLSLLDGIFGEAHVGKSPAIPREDLGEDKQEATRINNTDGPDEDAELTLCATRKANLAKRKVSSPMVDDVLTKEDKNPLLLEYKKNNQEHAKFRYGHVGKSSPIPREDLGEDKQEATRVNIDGSDKDAELTPSAMKKAKLAIPGEDLGEDKEVATRVNIDGPDKDAELTPSAMKKAKLAIPGEDLGDNKEVATPVNIDGPEKDAELTPSAMEEAKSAKRKVSSPMIDVLTKEDKNPVPQKYKKARDDLTTSAEASSCDSGMVPTIREAVGLIRECGVSEGTALFYTATKVVVMNPEYRELFSLIQTREGRLDWLQRAHDDTAMRVHLCSSK